MPKRMYKPPDPLKDLSKALGRVIEVVAVLLIGLLIYQAVDYKDRPLVLTGFLFVALFYAIFRKKL